MGRNLGKILIILTMMLTGVLVAANSSIAAEKFTVGEELAGDGRFIAYDDGTVLDKTTNLLWAARDNGKNINWADARLYCESYDGGGYKNWRLPSKEELKSLYDRLIFGNKGFHLTKFITLTGYLPWTSDTDGTRAVDVNFGYSYETWHWDSLKHKSRNRALCVRSGREIKMVPVEQKPEIVEPPPPPAPASAPVPPPAPVTVAPPPPPPPPPAPVQEKVSIALNIEFDTGRAAIKDQYYNNIKKVADFMRQYPDTFVVIEGHTDDVDVYHNPQNNVRLSQVRADSVRKYLIEKFGVDGSRISAVGHGPNKPVADNNTEEGRQKNRRIEAVIETMVTK